MKLRIVASYQEMSRAAAQIIAAAIRRKPDLVLALPTGGTPLGTLEELARLHRDGGADFAAVTSFNIDEYVPLKPDNPQSYYYYLNEHLYRKVNIQPANTHVPDVQALDKQKAGRDYDRRIAQSGGLDFILLGIGNDGHIGFNMPDTELSAGTHLAALNEDTIRANSRFFASLAAVPTEAITMGVGIILQARKIVLLASGKNKAEVIAGIIEKQTVTTQLPASLLLLHPDVTFIIDAEAAELLNGRSNACEICQFS